MPKPKPDIGRWNALAGAAHWRSRELARLCGICPRQLRRQFHRALSCSPQRWLDCHRLEVAEQKLQGGSQVKAVSLDLDWNSSAQFCHWFKKHEGLTPSQFAAALQSAPHALDAGAGRFFPAPL